MAAHAAATGRRVMRCTRPSTHYVTFSAPNFHQGGGWCTCAVHAGALFLDVCNDMGDRRFTIRALKPGEGMLLTAAAEEEERTRCQYVAKPHVHTIKIAREVKP